MRRQINLWNQKGGTLLEVLIVAGALVSTGLTGVLLYQQTTKKMNTTSGRLALYSAVASVERRLVHACMETLFDFPEDLDRHLPVQGLAKTRTAIDGLRVGQKIQVSGGSVTINTLTLKHDKYLGRDISVATLKVTATLGSPTPTVRSLNDNLITDEIPLFVRIDNLTDPMVKDCAAMTNDQPIEGLAFIGSSQMFANVNNHSELFNYISCLSLSGGTVPCNAGNAAWGVNPTTGIPQTAPPSAPGTTPVGLPPVLPAPGRSIAHIPWAQPGGDNSPGSGEPDAGSPGGDALNPGSDTDY